MTPMPKDPIKAEEFREKQRVNTIKYFENPENRKKASLASKKRFEDPNERKKISDSEKGKIIPDDVRKKMSESKKGEKNANWGKHLSEERKKQIGDEHRGMHHSEETKKHLSEIRKGRPGTFTGKHHSAEARKKISDANKGKIVSEETRRKKSEAVCGAKNYNWKGGTTFLPYCPKFNKRLKQNVRNFFGNKCVLCERTKEENRGRNLSVHHVFTEKMACCENRIEEMESIRERLPIGIAQFGNDEFTEKEIMYIRMMVPLCEKCHGKQSKGEDLPYEQTVYRKFFTELILNEYGGKCYTEEKK
jgi:hypothetical protein